MVMSQPIIETMMAGSAFLALYETIIAVLVLMGVGVLTWSFYRRNIRDHHHSHHATAKNSIPMVQGGYPFFGHAIEFGSNTEIFLQRCKEQYGSIFGCIIMGRRFIFMDGSYKDTYFSCNSHELSFQEAVMIAIVPQFTVGLDAVTNQWHVPIIRRQMSIQNVPQYYSMLEEQILRVIDKEIGTLDTNKSYVHDHVPRFASNCVAACSAVSFLGTELGQNQEVLNVFLNFHQACFDVMNLACILPHSILWMVAGSVNKYKATIRKLVVPEIHQRRKKQPEPTATMSTTKDFLSVMLQTKIGGQLLPAEHIADRCMALIFASMVTTAGALRHALYDLAGYWDTYADRLIQEQKYVMVTHGVEITPAAFDAMPLLTAFLYESMRLSALPIQQTRVCMTDGIKDQGLIESNHNVRLPKGSTVCMSGFLATHDETIFDQPNEFRIERFLNMSCAGAAPSIITDPSIIGLFPFGIGRYACPGRYFALAEIKATLCTLLRNYTVRTVSGHVPKYHRIPIDTARIQEPVQFTKVPPIYP
jgi:cytochrome P450